MSIGASHPPAWHPPLCWSEWDHSTRYVQYVPWASYQIRKIAGCACAGNAGNVFPRRRFQRKLLVSDPGMHHGTCVTHVPWCMSGSLTCGDGENVPGIPGACAPAILRIWQEAHEICTRLWVFLFRMYSGYHEYTVDSYHSFAHNPYSCFTSNAPIVWVE